MAELPTLIENLSHRLHQILPVDESAKTKTSNGNTNQTLIEMNCPPQYSLLWLDMEFTHMHRVCLAAMVVERKADIICMSVLDRF